MILHDLQQKSSDGFSFVWTANKMAISLFIPNFKSPICIRIFNSKYIFPLNYFKVIFSFSSHLGGTPSSLMGVLPHPVPMGGTPSSPDRQSNGGGVPWPGQYGVPPPSDWMGYPPPALQQGRMGTPPPPAGQDGVPLSQGERATERVLVMWQAVCLLRSRRRTFLLWQNVAVHRFPLLLQLFIHKRFHFKQCLSLAWWDTQTTVLWGYSLKCKDPIKTT